MTKRQLIEEITDLNPTAKPSFLAEFGDRDLAEYLRHLRWVCPPRRSLHEGRRWSLRARRASDSPPREVPASTDPPAAQVAAQAAGLDEPARAASGQYEKTASPFAEDSSREDLPAWLF